MGLITRFLSGWAGLARFWAVIAALVGATGLTLHLMGPPAPRPQTAPTQAAPTQAGPAPGAPAAAAPGQPDAGKTAAAQPAAEAPAKTQPPARAAQAQRTNDRPGRDTPGPIADPDPALLEASPLDRDDQLPRIAADGRKAMQVYAAGFDTQTRRARVSLILAGIGMHESDSLHAARSLARPRHHRPAPVPRADTPGPAWPAPLRALFRRGPGSGRWRGAAGCAGA